MAYRLGILRAEGDVKLARANRLSDVYLLYQPYTFQNNAPFDKESTTSWAWAGVTVPSPLFNRNQGNIQGAGSTSHQSRVEVADCAAGRGNEVRQAEREYALRPARRAGIEGRLLPAATRVRDDAYRLFIQGGGGVVVFLNAQREYRGGPPYAHAGPAPAMSLRRPSAVVSYPDLLVLASAAGCPACCAPSAGMGAPGSNQRVQQDDQFKEHARDQAADDDGREDAGPRPRRRVRKPLARTRG